MLQSVGNSEKSAERSLIAFGWWSTTPKSTQTIIFVDARLITIESVGEDTLIERI